MTTSSLTVPKATNTGIMIDSADPKFGWSDLEFQEWPDPSGPDAPAITVFRTPIRSMLYTSTSTPKVMDLRGHVPHDYVPGTDIFIHVHWSHNNTIAISGNAVFTISSTYSKGYNRAIFPAAKSVTITYPTVDLTTTPTYAHMISEVQWCSNGGSASLFDTNLIEVDGLIIATISMTTQPSTQTGGNAGLFIHRVDMHYQTTGHRGTRQKNYPFYT